MLDISNIKRISYREDINILRAIAVLGVVFYHAEIKAIKGGWLGVDIFFVISGFLISNIIISELVKDTFSFKNFYLRRIRRIIPALFSVILITLPFSYWLLTPRAMLEFIDSIVSSILFYSNYYFQNLDFYNAEPTKVMPLLHTWSLSIEEQFYIIFPLVCFLLIKYFKRYFFLIILIFLFTSIFLNSTTSEIIKFYQIQYRSWELLIGVAAMFLNQNKIKTKNLSYIGYILILYSILNYEDTITNLNSIEPRSLAVLGAAIVLVGDNKTTHNKILLLIGYSSYSLYLFHQPFFAFYRLFSARYLSDVYIFVTPFLIIFIVIISYFHWKYVELYFQKLKFSNFLKIFVVVLIIFILFILFSNSTNGFESRYESIPQEVLFYSNNTNIYPNSYSNANYLYSNQTCDNPLGSSNLCYWHNDKNIKTIYLIGDSLTNSLSVSFLEKLYSAIDNYNFVFIRGTGGRCLLSQQSDTVGVVEQCENEYFEDFIKILDKEDIVVAFGSFHIWLTDVGQEQIKCSDCEQITVIKNRLYKISENVNKLIIIQPNPTYDLPIADAFLSKRFKWGEPVTKELGEWEKEILGFNNFIRNLNIENIEILHTTSIFCTQDEERLCYASKNETLYYSDENHLTLDGANLITNKLNQLINP